MKDNQVAAGETTKVIQSINVTGVNGDAGVGSINGSNYAKVGAQFNGTGVLTGGYLDMDQRVNTSEGAYANQSGFTFTLNTTLGGSRTRSEAGNISGNPLVYVETRARGGLITVNGATAFSNNTGSKAYEDKTRSLISGKSVTTAYAYNGTSSTSTYGTGTWDLNLRTQATALTTLTSRSTNIIPS
jgi:hypothetical protein